MFQDLRKGRESETLYISKLPAAFLRVSLVILSGVMWISKMMDFESFTKAQVHTVKSNCSGEFSLLNYSKLPANTSVALENFFIMGLSTQVPGRLLSVMMLSPLVID